MCDVFNSFAISGWVLALIFLVYVAVYAIIHAPLPIKIGMIASILMLIGIVGERAARHQDDGLTVQLGFNSCDNDRTAVERWKVTAK